MFMSQLSRLPLKVEILNILQYIYDFSPSKVCKHDTIHFGHKYP